ncbi:MAG: hypothetical protein NTZ32_27025 [Planctomycetales bacterium]|nr:hypothetical protein [Planctomycetales bacterium]
MAEPAGTEPIDDDELIYRRIPVSMPWYSNGHLSPEAFDPHPQRDITGISVSRSKHKTLEDAAKGPGRKGYFVAVFRAHDLRLRGIEVVPRPIHPDDPENPEYDPGHAELPALTAQSRGSTPAEEAKLALTTLAIEVKGPFITT